MKVIFLITTLALNVLSGFFAKLSVVGEDVTYILSFIAIGLLGVSLVFYRKALKHFPLFLVQSVTSLKFVFLVLVAYFYFQESISMIQWIGICFIWIGSILILNGEKKVEK